MADPMKHGSFSWNELCTRDVPAAAAFYCQLLGWTTRDMDMGGGRKYTIFKSGNDDVGGMMAIEAEWGEVPPHWMSYITVDDVDACFCAGRNVSAARAAFPDGYPKRRPLLHGHRPDRRLDLSDQIRADGEVGGSQEPKCGRRTRQTEGRVGGRLVRRWPRGRQTSSSAPTPRPDSRSSVVLPLRAC